MFIYLFLTCRPAINHTWLINSVKLRFMPDSLLIDAEKSKLVVLSEGRPIYDSLSQCKYAQHGFSSFCVAPVIHFTPRLAPAHPQP